MESRAVVGSMVHPLSMLASPASRVVSGPAARSPVIVSYLEMRDARALRPKFSSDPRFQIRECTVPQWRFNRFLYEAVGAEWQWSDKRVWSDEQWREYVESPQLRTFAATYDGSPAGYYELCRSAEPDEEFSSPVRWKPHGRCGPAESGCIPARWITRWRSETIWRADSLCIRSNS